MRLLDLLIKGAGHKYIKRIPVGTTKTGKVRYRYIYSATHTVGGKHLLDEAHLKPGAKLMLHSKDGAEVHAHIESVKGDQVTFTYDDGERKGESRTVSKQQLLAEFNKEHKVGEQIDSAKAALLADIRAAGEKGFSKKQLARLVARLERLGGSVDKEESTEQDPAQEYAAKNRPPKLSKEDMDSMTEKQLMEEYSKRLKYSGEALSHSDPRRVAMRAKVQEAERAVYKVLGERDNRQASDEDVKAARAYRDSVLAEQEQLKDKLNKLYELDSVADEAGALKEAAAVARRQARRAAAKAKKAKAKETKPKETKAKETKAKELSSYELQVLTSLRTERNYNAATVEQLNNLRDMTGLKAAELDSALRVTNEQQQGDVYVYTLPNGDKIGVKPGKEAGSRAHYLGQYQAVDGRIAEVKIYNIQLKPHEAARLTATTLASEPFENNVSYTLTPNKDAHKRLTTLKDLEADIPRMEAITSFSTVEATNQEMLTHTQETAASYTAIPGSARKVLDELSTAYKRRYAADRPFMDAAGEVTMTDGVTMFSAKINKDSIDPSQAHKTMLETGFDKKGQPVKLQSYAPPVQDLKDQAAKKSQAAFSLDAQTAKKIHEVLKAQHKNNVNPVTLEPTGEKGVLEVTFMGKTLARVKDHRPEGHYEPVAYQANHFRQILSTGAATFHLPTEDHGSFREARTAGTVRKMRLLRATTPAGTFVTAGAVPDAF